MQRYEYMVLIDATAISECNIDSVIEVVEEATGEWVVRSEYRPCPDRPYWQIYCSATKEQMSMIESTYETMFGDNYLGVIKVW